MFINLQKPLRAAILILQVEKSSMTCSKLYNKSMEQFHISCNSKTPIFLPKYSSLPSVLKTTWRIQSSVISLVSTQSISNIMFLPIPAWVQGPSQHQEWDCKVPYCFWLLYIYIRGTSFQNCGITSWVNYFKQTQLKNPHSYTANC